MKTRLLVGSAIVAFLVLIAGVVYYLSIPASQTAPPVMATSEPSKPAASLAGKEGAMKTVTTPPQLFNGRLSPEATSIEEFSSNPKRDPEEQGVLDLVAQRGVPDQIKVQQLLAMIPSLPPDAQTLAMENATVLIPDTDYPKYRSQLLQLAKSPEMREAIMDDSLTRGEELRLPNLLEMMRNSISDDEKREIREILEAYLDKDYGPHPAQWEIPLNKWIAENTEN